MAGAQGRLSLMIHLQVPLGSSYCYCLITTGIRGRGLRDGFAFADAVQDMRYVEACLARDRDAVATHKHGACGTFL